MTDSLLSAILGSLTVIFSSLGVIKDYAAAAAVILAAIPLLLIAKDLTLDWAKKLVYIAIIIGIWEVLVTPYSVFLKNIPIYALSVTPFGYSMITEDTAIFLNQTFIFITTMILFRWIFKVDHPENGTPTSQGFTSRRLH